MSYQVGDACYATAVQAAQATAAQHMGAFVMRGGEAYVVSRYNETATQIQYWMGHVGGSASFVQNVPFTPMPCNLLTAADGLQMGWMVAAAWLGAYALLFLTRAFRGETETGYGHGNS